MKSHLCHQGILLGYQCLGAATRTEIVLGVPRKTRMWHLQKQGVIQWGRVQMVIPMVMVVPMRDRHPILRLLGGPEHHQRCVSELLYCSVNDLNEKDKKKYPRDELFESDEYQVLNAKDVKKDDWFLKHTKTTLIVEQRKYNVFGLALSFLERSSRFAPWLERGLTFVVNFVFK